MYDRLPSAKHITTKTEMLKQLENELSNIKPSFRHSKLYKLLKAKLTDAGYWRAKARGNPKAGFRAMQDKLNGTGNG